MGKLAAEGGGTMLAEAATLFRSVFAATAGKLQVKSLNGKIIQLGSEEFTHIMERHIMPFWKGTRANITTFFPEEWLASDILEERTKAVSKTAIVEGKNKLALKNGVTALVWVKMGSLKPFIPRLGLVC